MAKKKYQKKKENLDARLAAEGKTREAGRIVPIRKEKTLSESSPNEAIKEKKVVVPPSAKTKPVTKPQPSRKTSNAISTTQYSWMQKAIVFGVVFGLVAVGFAALAGTTQTTPTPEVTPSPSESIISEQTITVPPAEPSK